MFRKPSAYALLAAALAPASLAQTALVQDAVYTQGLLDFVEAARTSQADVLLIGDSTVLTNGGHAFGLNSAFANDSSFGLAGSGLLSGLNENEGLGGNFFQVSRTNEFGNDTISFTANGVPIVRTDPDQAFNFNFRLPDERAGFSFGTAGVVLGVAGSSEPTSSFGIAAVNTNNVFGPATRGVEIDGQSIAAGSAHTFTFDVAYDPTGDLVGPLFNNPVPTDAPDEITFDVVRRSFNDDGTIRQDIGGEVTLQAGTGFSTESVTFADDLGDYEGPLSFTLQTRNTPTASGDGNFGIGLEIGNFRVRADDTTGVTVTSIGFGGRSTRELLDLQYLPLTEDFRESTLAQLNQGGSGETLVIISETFNDLSQGDSLDDFAANITELIDVISTDFVALGQQQLGVTSDEAAVAEFSEVLRNLALEDTRLSFFDLRSLTVGETDEEVAERLDASRLHVREFDDAEFFGNGIVNALGTATLTAVPEPTSFLLLSLSGLTFARRRRA